MMLFDDAHSSGSYDILSPTHTDLIDGLPIPTCLSSDATLSTFSLTQHSMMDVDDDMDMMFADDSEGASEALINAATEAFNGTTSTNLFENATNSAVKQRDAEKVAERRENVVLKSAPVKATSKATKKKTATKKSRTTKSQSKPSTPPAQPAAATLTTTPPPKTVLLPSGASVKIIGALPSNFTLSGAVPIVSPASAEKPSENILKRKRSDNKNLTHDEVKKAAKRQRNRVLAQQSRDRKKQYLENLEKENAELASRTEKFQKQMEQMEQQQVELKHAVLFSTKKRVVLCMLICVALLVVSQQGDEIPARLAEVELPADLPKDLTKLDLINEQFTQHREELEKELFMALPPSVVQSIASKAVNGVETDLGSSVDPKAAATQHLVHEITKVLKAKDELMDGKNAQLQRVVKSRRKGKSQAATIDMMNAQHCDSEDSDEDNQQ